MMVEVRTTRNTNTIGGFVGQLRDMLDKLVKAQAKHRAVHAKMMKQCLNEERFRKKEIDAAKNALARATKSLVRCTASLKTALKELPSLERSLATYKKELRRAQKQRDVEREKYEKRRQAIQEALQFLSQFTAYVNKKLTKYTSSNLLELSENLLRHSAKLSLLQEAVPVLAAIATEATSTKTKNSYKFTPNEVLANRLRTLLGALLKRIQADNKANEDTEKAAVAIFVVYKARLDKVISTLDRNVKRVKKQISTMRRCITVEKNVLVTAVAKKNRNARLRANAAKMCGSFNKEFIEATYNRLNEIRTMQEIIAIVKGRFKDLPKDLVTYLDTVKDGWVKYTNSTEFAKFKEYERKIYAVNKRGKLLTTSNADKDLNPEAAVLQKR